MSRLRMTVEGRESAELSRPRLSDKRTRPLASVAIRGKTEDDCTERAEQQRESDAAREVSSDSEGGGGESSKLLTM